MAYGLVVASLLALLLPAAAFGAQGGVASEPAPAVGRTEESAALVPRSAGDLPLDFVASVTCGTREEFLPLVLGRLTELTTPDHEHIPRLVRVQISEAKGVWHGSLWLVDQRWSSVRRHVEAQRCDELLEAMAVIVALALDAQRFPSPSEDEPMLAPWTAEAPAELQPLAPPIELSSGEQGLAEAPQGSTAAQPMRARLDSGSPNAPPLRLEGTRLGASLLVRSEFRPEIALGGEATLWHFPGESWGIRLGLGAATPGSVGDASYSALFVWMGAALDGCYRLPVRALLVCAGVEPGLTFGHGTGGELVRSTESDFKTWLAAGPALHLQLLPLEGALLHVGFAARKTLVPSSFSYADPVHTLYEAPSYAFSALFGATWSVSENSPKRAN